MPEPDIKQIVKIISELVATVNTMRLYAFDHPQMASFIDRLYGCLIEFFQTSQELTLFVLDDEIIVSGKPLLETGTIGQTFINLLSKKNLEHISLQDGLSKNELVEFLRNLASSDILEINSSQHIKISRLIGSENNDSLKGDNQPPYQDDIQRFQAQATSELKSIYSGIHTNQRIDPFEARNFVVSFIQVFNQSINPMKYLAAIKSEDEYTYVHTINVALLTMSLANYLGFSGKHLVDITFAALMHDIGKMLIPDEILNKPSALNPEERLIMETHTIKGAQYIGQQPNMPKLTMLAALEHHVKFNGSGYPVLGANWRPHIASQMISVADIYDALRSRRPYREPLALEKIHGILRQDSGTALNPMLVEHFISMVTHGE